MSFAMKGGLESGAAVGNVLADLVGQDITAKSITLTQTTGNVAVQLTTGARLKLGSGTGDYFTSDGSLTISTPGILNIAGTLQLAGLTSIVGGYLTAGDTAIRGNIANAAGVTEVKIATSTTLTVGVDRWIIDFYSDNGSVLAARINSEGDYVNTSVNGTAGSGTGITVNATSISGRHYIQKITVINTALTAAANTQDITLWTVPAKTRVLRVIAETTVGFTGGALATMTVMVGPGAGSNAYLLAGSVFAASLLGDVAAEIGAGLLSATVADIPSFSAPTAILTRFTSTGAFVNAATAGSVTFYLECMTYP